MFDDRLLLLSVTLIRNSVEALAVLLSAAHNKKTKAM